MLRIAAAVFFIATAGQAAAVTYTESFTSFYVLGDSTSDDGRLEALLPPPSFEGRFSNGRVAPEFVSDLFEQNNLPTFNFALGGATAADTNENDAITPSPFRDAFGTFSRQVTTLQSSGAAAVAGDKPLVSAAFGANDFSQGVSAPGFNPIDVAIDVVSNIQTISMIPSFDNFLVVNLPDLSKLPANAGLSDFDKALLTGSVKLYNGALEAALKGTAAFDPSFNFQVFDFFSAFDDVLSNAPSQGLNTNIICTPSIADPNDTNICPTPQSADGFFFVDAVHVSAKVQSQIADILIAETEGLPAPVPLPAGLTLLLTSLGLVWLVGRRHS
ncbi:MAG: SGNH/GDSL hydrolase family protein [Pseudomonadota bacterium]